MNTGSAERVCASIILFESLRLGQIVISAGVFHGRWHVLTASGWRVLNDERRAV